jgi:tripeptide aminopeptidase
MTIRSTLQRKCDRNSNERLDAALSWVSSCRKERVLMSASIDVLLQEVPRVCEAAKTLRDKVLANLVFIGEVGAPTFREERRVQVILHRFAECGLHDCSTDEMMNAFGLLPGCEGNRTILVVSNSDTLADEDFDPHIEIRSDEIVGPFVGDNSPALATMAIVPELLELLRWRLKSNVIFMGAARSLGRGSLEGLRYFLNNRVVPIHYGLCVESVHLSRLNYSCLGTFRGKLTCRLPDNYRWTQYGAIGAIIPLNDAISLISQIAMPRRPLTNIILGSIQGGISYQKIARETTLRFEVRSESVAILDRMREQIADIADEVAARAGVHMDLEIFARSDPGGINISHPMVRTARSVISNLGLQPILYPTTTSLAALIEAKIPAVTVGLTTGERRESLPEIEETLRIEPIVTGLAQLAILLKAIDEGYCDET